MKFFDKLFGKSEPSPPVELELPFKSNNDAFEYELKVNPCSNPASGDFVMGIVLNVHSRSDGVQCAHVVTSIASKPLDDEEKIERMLGRILPSDLMQLAKGNGTIVSNACCTDYVPPLVAGDFVQVQLTMIMPNGMNLGIITQAAQPILHPQYGWKNR